MRLLSVIAVMVSSSASPAAVAPPWGGACTLSLEPSVVVQVVDAGGTPQPNSSVTFTLDGGPVEQAYCRVFDPWPGNCIEWGVGEEQLGLFSITATDISGTSVTQDVPVTVRGRCHVETQYVTLVLP
jgi:hypothetical protein